MQNNTQLLITFTTNEELSSILNLIQMSYHIIDNKIFILKNSNDDNEILLSYNIDLDAEVNVDSIPFNTIACHRKKHTNTIYTINAINKLITQLNGVLNKEYQINWNDYSNSVLIIKNNEFKKINTELIRIFKFL